jgi:hypothetical protein
MIDLDQNETSIILKHKHIQNIYPILVYGAFMVSSDSLKQLKLLQLVTVFYVFNRDSLAAKTKTIARLVPLY